MCQAHHLSGFGTFFSSYCMVRKLFLEYNGIFLVGNNLSIFAIRLHCHTKYMWLTIEYFLNIGESDDVGILPCASYRQVTQMYLFAIVIDEIAVGD